MDLGEKMDCRVNGEVNFSLSDSFLKRSHPDKKG
jgi:hypothetical protein